MNLDTVVRAVIEYKGERGLSETDAQESEARAARNIVYPILVGFIIVFVGAVLAILGKQIDPWVKTSGALLVLLGIFTAVFGALYATIRESDAGLRKPFPKQGREKAVGKGNAGELTSGDDFVPVASVTENTTRELDKRKTKIIN